MSMKMPSLLGRRLRQAREERGLTQAQLGDQVGVTEYTICRLETGFCQSCDSSLVVALCRKLGKSADWLLGVWDE